MSYVCHIGYVVPRVGGDTYVLRCPSSSANSGYCVLKNYRRRVVTSTIFFEIYLALPFKPHTFSAKLQCQFKYLDSCDAMRRHATYADSG